MRRLTVAQRVAIRDIHDEGAARGARTIASLIRRGLVTINGETMVASLTTTGERAYEQIMSSGDGPEDLKELFRPLFRGAGS